jgi:uncharacterized repeat protein (TIGR03803 family)
MKPRIIVAVVRCVLPSTTKLLATAGVLLALVSLSFIPVAAQSYTVLHSFTDTPDGAYPSGGVTIDPKGNVYVTTAVGGSNNQGTVVRISPTGAETILYSFRAAPDGNEPMTRLARDQEGNIYGTTYAGGSAGLGTIFKLTKAGRKVWLTSLLGGMDGQFPQYGGVILDSTGNVYGVTDDGGGTNCPPYVGCGTMFKVDPIGLESVFYRFTGMPDGAVPSSQLVLDNAGNFYGTTLFGGSFNFGTVFKITPQGEESVLHSFAGPPDGATPLGDLSIDTAGNLYGTTESGGTGTLCNDGGVGCGTIFKLDTQGNETVLYSFKGAADGFFPLGGVILDKRGNLFGTAGGFNGGNAFAFGNGTLKVLHSFTGGPDGSDPEAGLTFDPAGNLYGTTFFGGDGNRGVVFRLYPYKTSVGPNNGEVAANPE